jgi:phosphatidylserine/phosphatidylglycerophosphate/cardiolipin synthase-like enzyme
MVTPVITPPGDCLNAVLRELCAAKRSIDVAMYHWTNLQHADVVIDKHNRGLAVRVILDARRAATHYSKRHRLEANDVAVKLATHLKVMHAKIAIIDRHRLLIGSYNWAQPNEHLGADTIAIIDNEPVVIAQYEQAFDTLWRNSEPSKTHIGLANAKPHT